MRLGFVAAVALVFCVCPLQAREIEHRIVSKPGQTNTTLAGCVPKPDDVVVYVLQARAGQHFFLRLEPGPKLVAQVLLVPPSGVQVGPGAEVDHVAEESGMFRIRIIPRERSSGKFRLHLSLR
jgi:hypothetical protein